MISSQDRLAHADAPRANALVLLQVYLLGLVYDGE